MNDFKYDVISEKDYKSLLNLLESSAFSNKYPIYTVSKRGILYIITKTSNKSEGKETFIVFNNPVEAVIKFQNSSKEPDKLTIYSSLDLNNYCLKNNLNIYNFSIENVYNFDKDYLAYLSSYMKNYNLSLLFKQEKQLAHKEKKKPLESKTIYALYYEEYFYENIEPNTEIFFSNNKDSNSISFNLNLLLYGQDNSLKEFKFTGPISIGKTTFLLYFCHLSNDAFYINLKLLKKIDCIEKAYLLLKEEFTRADNFEDIQKIIDAYYIQGLDPIELVFEIIDYFSKSSRNVLFAFDQYKDKYLNPKVKAKLDNLKENIKIVYCSSINDKSIHDECSKTWNRYNQNIDKLNNETQKYYFYYSSLYEANIKKKKGKYNRKI